MTRFYKPPVKKANGKKDENPLVFGSRVVVPSVTITSNTYVVNSYNGVVPISPINNFKIDSSLLTNSQYNTICLFKNMILPYSGITGSSLNVINSTVLSSSYPNGQQGTNYYIHLTYDTTSIPQYGLGLYFPTIDEVTANINPSPICFTTNDVVYIVETNFPYPVSVWDSNNIDIHFVQCNFTNSFNACTTGPSFPSSLLNFTQFTTQQDFLLSLNKTSSTPLGNYYFTGDTNLNIPSVGLRDFWPLQVSSASTIFNSGQFYLNVTFDPSHGIANTNVTIYQIDNSTYSDATEPILQLYGNGTVSVVKPVDAFLTITNKSSGTIVLKNSNFSRGVTFDLTQGTGNINMDYCKIFSPPLTSSNVYSLTTIGYNTKLGFTGNSSVVWTGYGSSYPWLTKDNSGNEILPTDTLTLSRIVNPILSSSVNYVFSKAQDYSFATIPYNAHYGNIILSDSTGIYNIVGLENQTTLRPLTTSEVVYQQAVSDKGYEKSFNSKIKPPAYPPNIIVNNLTTKSGLGLYSTNANLTVNSFTVSSGLNPVNYLFTTGGSSNINLSGNNYTMTLSNGKNFWNNSSSGLNLSNIGITYNLYGNVNMYEFTSDVEYQGLGSMYDQTVNLLDGADSYIVHTDQNFIVNPFANINITNSNIANSITLTSSASPYTITVTNSKLYDNHISQVISYNGISFNRYPVSINVTSNTSNGEIKYSGSSNQSDIWMSADNNTNTGWGTPGGLYNTTYLGSTVTSADSINYYGEWIQQNILLNRKIAVSSYYLQVGGAGAGPTTIYLLGSNDGSTWSLIDTQSSVNWPADNRGKTFSISTSPLYSYFRWIFGAVQGESYLGINELRITNSSYYVQVTNNDYYGNLITTTGINTIVNLSNGNNLYIRPNQFITNNNSNLIGGTTSTYNLIGVPGVNPAYTRATGLSTRHLEKQYGANLITNNAIYDLSNIVNDPTGNDVPFKLSVGTANVKIVNTAFPNQSNIYNKYGSSSIYINNCTLTNKNNQLAVLDLTNSNINMILKNDDLTATNNSHLFINFALANIFVDPDPVTFYLAASDGYYDLNVEPEFVNELSFANDGYYQIGTPINKLNREVIYHAVGHQIFNIYAMNSQTLTTNSGNITQIGGDITANVSEPYALILSGEGEANVLPNYPLTLKTVNSNGDLLNIIGTNKNLLVDSSANINMPTSHRIPITANIQSGSGTINIGKTQFTHSLYPYVYWPQLFTSTASQPFTSDISTKYVATSWLPNKVSGSVIPYAFTKNNTTTGNCDITSGIFTFGPKYTITKGSYNFTMAVAPGVSDNLNAGITFNGATNLLPGANASATDTLFDGTVVAKGAVGYLNSYQKSISQSDNKYVFNYKLDSDQYNYYFGTLNANINLSGNNNSLYPQFRYSIIDTTSVTFGLELLSSGNVVSKINLDVYNDIEAPLNYQIVTNNSRQIILPGYVYFDRYNGNIAIADVKATYSNASPINITTDGVVLTGSNNINISNIAGILPNNPWTIDCRFNPTTIGSFTILKTRGDNNYAQLVLSGDNTESGCNLSVAINGVSHCNIALALDNNNYYHPAVTYLPTNFNSNQYGNVNTRNNSGGLLSVFGNVLALPTTINLSDYSLPNVTLNALTLGDELSGTLRDVRISYVNLPGTSIANIGLDSSNVETTVFYNSLTNNSNLIATSNNLQSIEESIYDSQLIGNLVFSTPDYNFGNNHYYTYLRPNYLLSVVQPNTSFSQASRLSFIKGDNTTDNYWVQNIITAGVYFTSDFVNNPFATPLASNVVTIINTTPNYLFPQGFIGYAPSGYTSISSNVSTLISSPTDFSLLNIEQTSYSEDFIFTIKMANLPDSGNAKIYLYTDTNDNPHDVYFNFFEVGVGPSAGANLMVLSNINGQNIYAANVSLQRTVQQGYINRNNTATFYVKTSINNDSVIIGNTYPGNIIIHPDFKVEDYSVSLPFSLTNTLIPTVDGVSTFNCPVPFIIKLGIGNTVVKEDIGIFQGNLKSSGYLTQGSSVGNHGNTQYLFASLVGSSPGNVIIPINGTSNLITNIANLDALTSDINGNILSGINNTFNFFIPVNKNKATNTAEISVTYNDRIWGDSNFTATVGNILVDGLSNISTQPSITIPYLESNRRQITFSGIDRDYQNFGDIVTYGDANVVSNEIITSSLVNLNRVGIKTGILSREMRHGFSMRTNSIDHRTRNSSANVTLQADLSFMLVSTSNTANAIPITNLVNIYDGNLITSNVIRSKSITIDDYSTQLLNTSANIVYLDFSDVDFNSYGSQSYTLLNVYANVHSNISPDTSDYGTHNNLLVWQLDFSNVSINYTGALDYLIVGNWRFITNIDGTLLLQYKNNYEDAWVTKSSISNL